MFYKNIWLVAHVYFSDSPFGYSNAKKFGEFARTYEYCTEQQVELKNRVRIPKYYQYIIV